MTDAPLESRASYRTSGRVRWSRFFPGSFMTAVVAAIMAWCLFWVFQRGFYLIFVAPLLASAAVAGVWYLVLTWSHCRNPRLNRVSSLALALLLYLGYYYVGLVHVVGIQRADRIDLLPRYVQFRMKTDVAHDPRHVNPKRACAQGPDRVQRAFNWVFFGSELIVVLGVIVSVGHSCVSRAYCESCSQWMKSETLKLPAGVGTWLWDALREDRYDVVRAVLTNTSRAAQSDVM